MTKFLLIFFTLIRIFSNPIANVFQKKLSVKYSSITINFYTYLILSLLCLLRTDILLNYDYNLKFIILVITCGFLCTAGMLCMIKAVSIGELSVLGPINSYKSVISLIIAIFLLKEIPNIQGIIGMLLMITGSKYIFIDDNNKYNLVSQPARLAPRKPTCCSPFKVTTQKFCSHLTSLGLSQNFLGHFKFSILKRKDIQFRFLAMTLTAIEAVLLKKIILISSVEICFMFWCFMGLIWNILILIFSKRTLKLENAKALLVIFSIAVCLGLMQYSTNYVFERMNVGFALCVFQLSSIVTVLFGWKIFKERNIKSKLIGCIIMIIGSCLILLT